MDPELQQYLEAMESRLTERMRDMQTELLKAFLPFQQEAGLRHSAVEVRMNGVEQRQAILENRLAEIEKRLLLNPPAA